MQCATCLIPVCAGAPRLATASLRGIPRTGVLSALGNKFVFLLVGILIANCASQPPPVERIPLSEIINFREMGGGEYPMNWIATPILPNNPSQADLGSFQYWFVCMSCHGESGQGLTDEWRAQWGQEEQNCWQSKCHASNYPPGGFVFPNYAPPVIGKTTLLRFNTAQELYDYLATEMPWWAPGSLTDEVYWQLTAFLLRENGVVINIVLGENNANKVTIPPN